MSSSGSDSNSGTSQTAPWQSIGKVNSTTLDAGDTVLFEGGQTFSGSLEFRSGDGGSSSTPVTISSYGSGRATIKSGSGDGAYDYGTSGIWIENLIFVGTAGAEDQDGVRFEAPAGDSESNGRVINCDISGYQLAGIYVLGGNNAGFDNVELTNNSVHNNVQNGIVFQSNQNNANKNELVSNNSVYDNAGINPGSNDTISGSGIELGGVNGATVEYNNVYSNGASGQGGCGIWCYESTGVLMQYNISHNNTTHYGHDGDGFDLDLDTQNSIVQYNYSYENAGAGFMMDQWQGNNDFKNNVIRYNISQDDGRQNTYAGLSVFGSIEDSAFYNNVVYLTPAASVAGIRVKYSALGGSYVSGLVFANNVIDVTGSVTLINIPSDEIHGSNLTFVGNDYWTNGSSVYLVYGSTTYSSVSAWASATGEEKLNGTTVGKQVDPDFSSAGQGAALTNPSQLKTLTAYELLSGSPLINAGINVASNYGFAAPSSDFYGDATPQGGAFDIGAFESGGAAGSSGGGATGVGDGGGGTTSSGSTGSGSTGQAGSTGGSTTGSGTSGGTTSGKSSGGKTGTSSGSTASSGSSGSTTSGAGKSTGDGQTGTSGSGSGGGGHAGKGGGIVETGPTSSQDPTGGETSTGPTTTGQTGDGGDPASSGGANPDPGGDGQTTSGPGTATDPVLLANNNWQNSVASDPFHFDSTGFADDSSVMAGVDGLSATGPWIGNGIANHDQWATEDGEVFALLTSNRNFFSSLPQDNVNSAAVGANLGAGDSPWADLNRQETIATGYISSSEVSYGPVAAAAPVSDSGVPVTLAAASLDAGPIEAIFRSVSTQRDEDLSGENLALPNGWKSTDIGSAVVAGESSHAKGCFILSASGSKTSGDSDASHFDYTRLWGNGQIVAKVENAPINDARFKAGVMIRDGSAANAREVSLLIGTAGKDAVFQTRDSTTGRTATRADVNFSRDAVRWVKLIRQGDTFVCYVSADGKTWTKVGSDTLSMNSNVEIGLTVAGQDSAALSTATFSDVVVK